MLRMCCLSRAAAAFVVVACAAPTFAQQGYDAIGPNNSQTTGNPWIDSATNTDVSGQYVTTAGSGVINIAAGKRVNLVRAAIGQRGPSSGAAEIDFANVASWSVDFWSDSNAFYNSPTVGDVAAVNFAAPTLIEPWGTDNAGAPAFRATFRMPGALHVVGGTSYLFAVRVNASFLNVGQVGIQETSAQGNTGLVMTPGFTSPQPFTIFGVYNHSGVAAYQVVVGCQGDHNGDGAVTVQDIFDFLGDWFANKPSADFNGSGSVTVQDIFDFLGAWFAGCTPST